MRVRTFGLLAHDDAVEAGLGVRAALAGLPVENLSGTGSVWLQWVQPESGCVPVGLGHAEQPGWFASHADERFAAG